MVSFSRNFILILLFTTSSLLSCIPEDKITYTTPYQLVVAPQALGLDCSVSNVPEVEPMNGNNNLSLAWHKNRLYFVFRTSETHFASANTRLYVLSSSDLGQTWRYETEVATGRDMREPLLFSTGERLLLYSFAAGTNPLGFEPGPTYIVEMDSEGVWADPRIMTSEQGFANWEDGHVVWRIRQVGNVFYMLRYSGGHYDISGNSIVNIEFLKSTDGLNWLSVNPDRPVVYSGGGSEADFGLDKEGNLYSVIRVEDYDKDGYGSRVCFAPKEDITDWKCVCDKYRYDSPNIINRDGKVYLLARRNLDGPYDKDMDWLPKSLRTAYYLIRYSLTKKHASLYIINQGTAPSVEWLFDFEGQNGDTSFFGVVPVNTHDYLVYNYSSEVGKDKTWIQGQLDPTFIYGTILKFRP